MSSMEETEVTSISRSNRWALNCLTAIIALLCLVVAAVGIGSMTRSLRGQLFAKVPFANADISFIEQGGVELSVQDAMVMFPDATTSMRWLAAGSTFTSVLLLLLMTAAVLWLRAKLLTGRPFVRVTTTLLMAVSLSLLIQTVIGTLLDSILTMQAVDQLISMNFPGFENLSDGHFYMQFDLLSFAAAVFLGILAGIFQIGERMQRETEGLV